MQQKWEHICKKIFYIRFIFYVVYLLAFTVVTLVFEHWTNTAGPACAVAWMLWVFSLLCSICVVCQEVLQVVHDPMDYISDLYNALDAVSVGLAFVVLAAMLAVSVEWVEDSVDMRSNISALKAMAGFLGCVKVIPLLRGVDENWAFQINMLVTIVSDAAPFGVILLIFMVAFAYAFFQLLTTSGFNNDESSVFSHECVGIFPISFVAVFDMMFGAFELEYFRQYVHEPACTFRIPHTICEKHIVDAGAQV